MGPTRNIYPDGTLIVEASTLQAVAHVAWNACSSPQPLNIIVSWNILS